MKAIFQTAMAGAVGLVLGAAGMSVLQAQTTEAPAFIIANIADVKNPDGFAKYRSLAGATQVPFGGRGLLRMGVAQPLPDQSGEWPSTAPKGQTVLIEFPNMKNLLDWWNSPAYRAVRPLRENATTGLIYAVQGLPPS